MASEASKDIISHVTEKPDNVISHVESTESISFQKYFLQFLDDLDGTFPEFKDDIKKLKEMDEKTAQTKFVKLWKDRTGFLLMQDIEGAIFDDEILPNIEITENIWKELSEKTKLAIFNHLNTLVILSADLMNDSMFDIKGIAEHMKSIDESPFMKHLFESMSSVFSSFEKKKEVKPAGGAGVCEDDDSEPKLPFKLPEKLFKGHIAKMAEELAKEFKPEDFGLSPELLKSSDPIKIFSYLQEIFTKQPELLKKAAENIIKKLQGKIERGDIKREELLAEAEEMMKEFGENEVFKGLFGSLGEMMKMSESSGSVSERRRIVQERLRKKLEARKAKKT